MRILVISNLYPPMVTGGYERECAGAVEHLRREHEVLVLTSASGRGRAGDPMVQRVLPLLQPDWRGSLRAPLASLRSARAARRAIDRFDPELIYVWNGMRLPVAPLLVAGNAGVPLAFRICEYWFRNMGGSHDQFVRHLSPGDRGLRAVWARLLRLVNRHPDLRLDPGCSFPAAISWNSDFLRRQTPVPPGVEPIHEETIYPALPQGDSFAHVRRDPSESPSILFIGRVAHEKGLEVLFGAVASLRDRHGIEAPLIVAGPIEEGMSERLDGLMRELELEHLVDLRGPLGADGLSALLASAHVVVVPPTWHEPAGMVCVEAALARVPVVASRSGGIPELFTDREHVLLFEIGDVDSCADRIAETLTRPGETEQRVARARARADQLSFRPYAAATDRFLAAAVRAFAERAPAPR